VSADCAAGICHGPVPASKAFFIAPYATRKIPIAIPQTESFVPTAEIMSKSKSNACLCLYQQKFMRQVGSVFERAVRVDENLFPCGKGCCYCLIFRIDEVPVKG